MNKYDNRFDLTARKTNNWIYPNDKKQTNNQSKPFLGRRSSGRIKKKTFSYILYTERVIYMELFVKNTHKYIQTH